MKQFQSKLIALFAKSIHKKIILALAINGLTINAIGQSDSLKEKIFPPDFNQQAEDALKPKTVRKDLNSPSKINTKEMKLQDSLQRNNSTNQTMDKKSKGEVEKSKINETQKKDPKKKSMNQIR